jgi:hypothetical protein
MGCKRGETNRLSFRRWTSCVYATAADAAVAVPSELSQMQLLTAADTAAILESSLECSCIIVLPTHSMRCCSC